MRQILLASSFVTLLVACGVSPQKTYSYVDFPDAFISFKDIFNKEKEDYLVYFYEEQCYYCNLIKQDVLSYLKAHSASFYLLTYTPEIPIKNEIEKTLGATSLEEVWFEGSPSLLEVTNHQVAKNIVGVEAIKSFLKIKQ